MAGKVGRPRKEEGNVHDIDSLDINPSIQTAEKDMYNNWLYWEGSAKYFNPVTQNDENLPKGKRAPKFKVIFEHNGTNFELRFDMTSHIERMARRAKK